MESTDTKINQSTILFVDDEKNILNSLKRLFFDQEYIILLANSAAEGLDIVRNKNVQLIVSDQRMPGMTGLEFLLKVKDLLPEAVTIILTGYADLDAAIKAINEGGVYRFITKPWNDEELKLLVKHALEFYRLRKENKELMEVIQHQNAELRELNEDLNQKVKERTVTIFEKNKELNKLYDELKDSLTKVIRVLASFLQEKSVDLGDHSKRVAAAARYIASALKLPEEEIDNIEIAALLHDIGMIGVPAAVIAKPLNQLSVKERGMYERHPLSGQNLVSAVEHMEEVGLIIRHHHENYNGTGFPDRLVGAEIPLGSRIIAVVNTYDYLVNTIYINFDNTRIRALKNLRSKSGAELDPDIVNLFMRFIRLRRPKTGERKELELNPFELKDGMIVSRDLLTTRGNLVFRKGHRLDENSIRTILDSHRMEKLFTSVFVYEH